MRKFFIGISLLLSATCINAQLPEDALRYGYPIMSGTARNQAIAGAGASLGGDITSAHINPAGIGMYKNREIVLTPGFSFINNNYTYKGAGNKSNDNAFSLGTSGLVFGKLNAYNPRNSSAWSISVTQLANYNNHVEYSGVNKISSWSEQYVEQLAADHASVNQAETGYPFGSSLAYWTFLVDTVSDAQGNVMGYVSQAPVPGTENGVGGVSQHNIIDTRGGAHEIALAYAGNKGDKVYFGGSMNFPIYSYTKDQLYREQDITTNPNNYFDYFEYREHYTSSGFGINFKLGVIVRPIDRLRLGLAIHTPTFASLTDYITTSITTNTENYTTYPQPLTKSSTELAENPKYEYSLMTPFKAIVSGSWVINEVSDITRQKGFITADIEYVNHNGTNYSALNGASQQDVDYYSQLNAAIKKRYKDAFNFKVGGELKFNTIMARAGFGYFTSPFEDKQLAGSRTLLSGGLGYRNKGFFVDLTYMHVFLNQTNVPYYLNDKPSPIADGKNNLGNLILTFGMKF